VQTIQHGDCIAKRPDNRGRGRSGDDRGASGGDARPGRRRDSVASMHAPMRVGRRVCEVLQS
jgi:hypothetical protein